MPKVLPLVGNALLAAIGASCGATPVAYELSSVRLYQTDDVLKSRVGPNIESLAAYLKALGVSLDSFWKSRPQERGLNLLVVAAVKPGRQVRFWLESSSLPNDSPLFLALEKELLRATPNEVTSGPVAFALNVKVWGGDPSQQFPEIPRAWREVAAQSRGPVSVPDGVLERLWP